VANVTNQSFNVSLAVHQQKLAVAKTLRQQKTVTFSQLVSVFQQNHVKMNGVP
jgi:hypothetical protein